MFSISLIATFFPEYFLHRFDKYISDYYVNNFLFGCLCVFVLDYAVKEKPLLVEDMQGGPDYIVLKTLDTDGIRIIGSVLGQSIALDYFVSQVILVQHFTAIFLYIWVNYIFPLLSFTLTNFNSFWAEVSVLICSCCPSQSLSRTEKSM